MSIHDHLPNVAMLAAGRPPLTPPKPMKIEPHRFVEQGGSKNEESLARAAAGDFRWLAEVARLQCEGWGLCLNELGAGQEFYGVAPRAGEMLGLKLAREAGDQESAKWLARVLRSYWHWLALGSYPAPVQRGWQMLGLGGRAIGRVLEERAAPGYTGVSTTVCGDRWNMGTVAHDAYGAFLSWAAGWPRVLRGANGQVKRLGIRARQGGLSLDVIANLGGVDRLDQEIDPAVFGLQPGDRERLQKVIRGDRAAATEATAIVMWECPPHAAYDMTRIRREGAAETISARTRNGNKPHGAYCSTGDDGLRMTLIPADFEKVGADAHWVRVFPDKIEAGDSDSFTTCPRPTGAVLYGFRFHGGRVESIDGGTVVEPPEPPQPPPGPKPPEPKKPEPSTGPPIPASGHHVTFRLPKEGVTVIVNVKPGNVWEGRRWKRDGGQWQDFE